MPVGEKMSLRENLRRAERYLTRKTMEVSRWRSGMNNEEAVVSSVISTVNVYEPDRM